MKLPVWPRFPKSPLGRITLIVCFIPWLFTFLDGSVGYIPTSIRLGVFWSVIILAIAAILHTVVEAMEAEDYPKTALWDLYQTATKGSLWKYDAVGHRYVTKPLYSRDIEKIAQVAKSVIENMEEELRKK